jgi:hypothetical protein
MEDYFEEIGSSRGAASDKQIKVSERSEQDRRAPWRHRDKDDKEVTQSFSKVRR